MNNPKGIRENGRDIYTVDFAEYLPDVLKHDPKMKAFAAAITEQMLTVSSNIDNVLIYSRIDELPEELVDILAYDMHVDWYDYSFPLDIKRGILKSSVKVHKRMGTKYAVETALNEIHTGVKIEEWFQYEGLPYRFRIIVDIGSAGITEDICTKIEYYVKFYKNLRSHCDSIHYNLNVVKAKVSTKVYAKMGTILKVKPYLEKQLEVMADVKVLQGLAVGETVKIKAGVLDIIKSGKTELYCMASQKIKNTMTIGRK